MEYNKEAEEECLRELKEETGLDGEVEKLLCVKSGPTRDPRYHAVSIFYKIVVDPEAKPKLGNCKYYNVEKLQK